MTTDLSPTIVPKSDQLNADDLITGPRTITVTKVSLLTAADQPIAINYDGDNGKPYKPCKSMRRVMVSIWGPDGAKYAGRRMTLYRDPAVKFGGMDVGGIRISHMSHIERPMTMALTVTRANRKPFTVQPMGTQPIADKGADLQSRASTAAENGVEAFRAFWKSLPKAEREMLRPSLAAYQDTAKKADAGQDEDPFATEDQTDAPTEPERAEEAAAEENAGAPQDAPKAAFSDDAQWCIASIAGFDDMKKLAAWWDGRATKERLSGLPANEKKRVQDAYKERVTYFLSDGQTDMLAGG